MKRELLKLAASSESKDHSLAQRMSLPPGTRLLRDWSGQTLIVEVLEEGFRFDDREWKSLSQIARHVTGTHRSGPRFFGIGKNG